MVKFASNFMHCPNIVVFKNVYVFGEKKGLGKVPTVSEFYNFNGKINLTALEYFDIVYKKEHIHIGGYVMFSL